MLPTKNFTNNLKVHKIGKTVNHRSGYKMVISVNNSWQFEFRFATQGQLH